MELVIADVICIALFLGTTIFWASKRDGGATAMWSACTLGLVVVLVLHLIEVH